MALTGDLDIVIPLTSGSHDLVFLALAQALQQKTINMTSNTITDTSTSTGDIPVSNGTKFLRRGIGTPGQVPIVNTGGTDWAWETPAGGGGGGGALTDNSVATNHIQALAVTNAKLASSSVSGDKISTGAIPDSKLQRITDHAKLPTDVQYITGTGTTNLLEFMTHKNWGMASGQNTVTGGAMGLFDPMTMITTPSPGLSSHGSFLMWNTGTTVNTLAGCRTTNACTRRELNPEVLARFTVGDVIGGMRIFAGFSSSATVSASSSNFLDGLHGFGLMLGLDATTFSVVRNDGTAADTNDGSGMPVSMTGPISVYLKMDNDAATPNVQLKVWTAPPDADTSFTPDKNVTYTTFLPAATTPLYFHMAISNGAATNKWIARYVAQIKSKW